MKLIKLLVFATATVLLAGGYVTSQLAYAKMLNTRESAPVIEYAKRIDVPTISFAALLILICCVVFVLIREPKEENDG